MNVCVCVNVCGTETCFVCESCVYVSVCLVMTRLAQFG